MQSRSLLRTSMLAVWTRKFCSPSSASSAARRTSTKTGREHWPQLGNQVLVGGGMKMGQIIGESTAKGDVPLSNPVSPNDLLATLFQFLGVPLDLQYTNQSGRPNNMLDNGKPIAALF